MSVILQYAGDYPITDIGGFESYLFIISPKFIAEHGVLDNSIVMVVDGKGSRYNYSMKDLSTRKSALEFLNNAAVARGLDLSDEDCFSVVMMDFVSDDDKELDYYDVLQPYDDLSNIFRRWCVDNDRLGVMAQHFSQKDRTPHVHIMYERKDKSLQSEFQDYLDSLPLCSY